MKKLLTAEQIRARMDGLSKALQDAFIAAVHDISSEAQISIVAAHIEAGRIEEAMRALHLGPEFFAPLDDAMWQAYQKGGIDAVASVSGLTAPFHPEATGLWRALMVEILAQKGKQESSQGR